MKRALFTFVLVTLIGGFSTSLLAQTTSATTCPVTIQMQDSYGDGWNGNSLSFYQGDSLITTITLTGGTSGEEIVSLPADSISMFWSQGSWAYECSFSIISYDGEILYNSPAGSMSGVSGPFATFENACPSCSRPSNLHLISRTIDQLVIGWDLDSITTYVVEYGPYGFTRGTGTFLSTTSNSLIITGLSPNSAQMVYIARLCDNGDTSRWTSGSFITMCGDSTCSYTVRLEDKFDNSYFYGRQLLLHESGAVIDTIQYPSGYYSDHYECNISLCPGTIKLKYEAPDDDYYYYYYYNPEYLYMLVRDAEGDTVSFSNVYNAQNSTNSIYDTIQYSCPSCFSVQNISISVFDSASASVSWRSTNAQQYLVTYGQTTDSLTSYSSIVSNDTAIILNGLAPSTSYRVYIRALCGVADSSRLRYSQFTTGPRQYTHIYVKANATGDNNGTSWTNAYNDLTTALSSASLCNSFYGIHPDIWIAAGTYQESNQYTLVDGINIYGGFVGDEPENYDIAQRNITANATILDGSGQHRVIYQGSDFNTPTTLSGLTITHGYVNSGNGAGLYLRGNTCLEYCTVIDNAVASNWNSVYGAGIYAYSDYSDRRVTIDHCNIKQNGTLSGYIYGALYLRNATISNSIVTGNQSYYTIDSYSGNNQIVNSLIYGNSAQYYSGIFNEYASLQISNSDVVANTTTNSSSPIYTYYSNSVTLNNSVVWGNQAAGTPSYFTNYGNYTLHNCAFDGLTDSIATIISLADSNDGTIDSLHYPRFVSPSEGDFALMTGSALIDAGDSA